MFAHTLLSRTVADYAGSVAAFCTTISFLPQLVRIGRRKRADDISFTMCLLFCIAGTCWLIYGLGIGSGPVIVTNTIGLSLTLANLVLKVKYSHRSGADD